MDKVTAVGYMILAARDVGFTEPEIKVLAEEMRTKLLLTTDTAAMDEFFDFDSKQFQLEGSSL